MIPSHLRLSSLPPPMLAAIKTLRPAFIAVAAASFLINMLMLVGPLFMLQVYDRVLPSRSVPTLVGLLSIAVVLLVIQGGVDTLRSRLLSRMAEAYDGAMRDLVFDSVQFAALNRNGDGLQIMRDLDTVRGFIAGSGPVALCDLPWTPLYILVCTLFHPMMGLAVATGAVLLMLMTAAAEIMTKKPTSSLVGLASSRRTTAETAYHHAEVVHAMGLQGRMAEIWAQQTESFLDAQRRVADLTGGFGSASRFLRMTLQSGVLALGAWLVINQQATAGVMLAATILSIRALAPIELAIANWRGFIAGRDSFGRICEAIAAMPAKSDITALPTPSRELSVGSISLMAPRSDAVVLHEVSFTLKAGNAVAVVGPSGTGKSTLARALVGVIKPARGVIRIDGAALSQWDQQALGRSIGFLPQDVALFRGTVADNIKRFAKDTDSTKLLSAAQQAGVHDMILRLPKGYETEVGDGGLMLSGGQRQRIALARALYGDPFLVVLDEPNSNLDSEGERALLQAIIAVRRRGGIVVVIAHRPTLISAVDHLLVLRDGRLQAFGTTESVLPLLQPANAVPAKANEPASPAPKKPAKQKVATHE